MNSIFNRLLKIALPPQFVVDENDQKMIQNLTFNDIFEYIKSEHWHQTKKQSCPHSESLYDHLLSCADICYEKAIKECYTKKDCVKAYLTGLLHDIGKPGTRRLLRKHTSFKGHGLVGGAMLENFYSKELVNEFELSEEDWTDISTCADVHMCSYFPQRTSKLQLYSVNILPESIKRMLFVLREGDQLSMIPDKTYPKSLTDIIQDVKNGEEQYRKTLFEEMSFSDLDKKKGILILIQGGSSCGKTTFANKLMSIFGNEICTYVNRDWYIVYWTVKLNKDIGENEEKFSITPSLYQRCYQKYVDSKKQ
jgi:putative nucleotidyltransferase with HDIG domain